VSASRPPVGAATRVNSVASGLQQNRSGANGEVQLTTTAALYRVMEAWELE